MIDASAPARLLEGQVALVTGAGRGLGCAFAERLASLGCRVGIQGMREEGPAEYGEGTTLTATAESIAAEHDTRTRRVLGDLGLARLARNLRAISGPELRTQRRRACHVRRACRVLLGVVAVQHDPAFVFWLPFSA